MKKDNAFYIAALAFLALLLLLFNEFIFDSSKLMLNSDPLNGLGTYYLRAQNYIVPLWDNSRLGGIPTIDAISGSLYHPLTVLRFFMDPGRAEGWIFIFIIWTAFVSAFILGRYLTDKWQWGALLGFLYALSPQYFTYIYGGHEGKMMVFGIAPFAMYSLLRLLREGSLKHLIYSALSVVWMITSPHLQLTYFFFWGAGFFVLFELFSSSLPAKKRSIRFGLTVLALSIGLAISAFQIIPAYSFTTTASVRGSAEKTTIEHSASWSLHSEELAAMILPGFLGTDVHKEQPNPNTNVYWGQNPFKLNADACGALLTFLALCGCLLPSNRKHALFWFFGSVIALSYAVGLHSFLFQAWYSIIPGVKNFRAPSMSIFWMPLAFLFLAAPVLKNLEENKKVLKQGAILYGILLSAILIFRYAWESLNGIPVAIFIAIYGAYFIKVKISLYPIPHTPNPKKETLHTILWAVPFLIVASFFLIPVEGSYFKPVDFARAANLFSHSLVSFAIIVATLGVAFFILSNEKMGLAQKALILMAVAAVDLYIINYPFVQNVPAVQYHNPNHPIIQAIKRDNPNDMERSRVYSVTRQPSISGNIFPAYNMRNALGFHDNEIATYRIFKEELQNSAMFDIMNIGYIIFDGPQGTGVQKNPSDLGRIRMYYNWETMESQEKIIEQLKEPFFDYRSVLLLENNPTIGATQSLHNATAKVIGDKKDKLTFEIESPENGLLFISENYHKYWKAKINGKDEEVLRAFSTFMAVPVPSGKSVVELRYSSSSLRFSLWIGAAGAVLLLGVAVWNVLRFLPKP
ncbi:MAG: YfhO family protein [Fibromonadales bacterium]|nr:YfhO family protein [Fibromonadales bacterium]